MKELKDSELDSILASNKNVVLYFGAAWCGPCKSMMPAAEKVAEDYKENVTFVHADIEECVDATDKYNIRAVPTLIFIRDGEKADRTSGSLPESKIREHVEKLING